MVTRRCPPDVFTLHLCQCFGSESEMISMKFAADIMALSG